MFAKIKRWINKNEGKFLLVNAITLQSLLISGVIWYELELEKYQGKKLSNYVEFFDGAKGFSKKDIEDFAEHAQLDSAQTKKAYENIPIDSLRDFSIYFNIFIGSDYKKPRTNNEQITTGEAITSGSIALDYYRSRERTRLKIADSTENKKQNETLNEKIRQTTIENYLQKVIIFPGSIDDYSKHIGYPIKSIPLARNDQSISLDCRDITRIRFNEQDSVKAHLYRERIEAIVYAHLYAPQSYSDYDKNEYRGLPVARDSSHKNK